ncbi:type II toxin-antitoxin system VapC family toxin [Aquipuribacter nitratireducens]|uniref:type II toxin-antitoxin system VapC family toxin n=1 Tax=Aquipuribacter nitratireducens TaxID=650104 RepID=UPI003BEEC887
MILDSSALAAVVLGEPLAPAILRAIGASDEVSVGAPTLVEASIVLRARAGEPGTAGLDRLLVAGEVDVIPLAAGHVPVALSRPSHERCGCLGPGDEEAVLAWSVPPSAG